MTDLDEWKAKAEAERAARIELERKCDIVDEDNYALGQALKECSDDLEMFVENHYEHTKDHGMRRQYERDMEPVHRARALLYPTKEEDENSFLITEEKEEEEL